MPETPLPDPDSSGFEGGTGVWAVENPAVHSLAQDASVAHGGSFSLKVTNDASTDPADALAAATTMWSIAGTDPITGFEPYGAMAVGGYVIIPAGSSLEQVRLSFSVYDATGSLLTSADAVADVSTVTPDVWNEMVAVVLLPAGARQFSVETAGTSAGVDPIGTALWWDDFFYVAYTLRPGGWVVG